MDAAEDERSYATLLTRLGFACLLLLPVMSGTEGWHQKSAGNSLASIVAGVSWVCYFLCLAAFVVVLALAGFRQLARKRMMNIK
jgi:hypothetical protein